MGIASTSTAQRALRLGVSLMALTLLPLSAGSAWAEANSLGAPPPLSAFGKLPDIDEVALSPDGKRVALLKDLDGKRAIFDVDLETNDIKGMGLGDIKVRHLFWGDNTRIVLIATQTANLAAFYGDKNEFATGQILDVQKGKAFALYKNIENFYPIVMGDYHRITTKNGPRVTASNVKIAVDGFRALYSFNLDTGSGLKMDEEPYHIENWVVRPDGEILARSEYDRDSKAWTLRYRKDKKWRAIYTEKALIERPSLVGRGRDNESVLVYIASGEKAGNYYEVSPEGVFGEPLDMEGMNVSPYFHPETRKLVGFVDHDPDGIKYKFYDPAMTKLAGQVQKSLPDYKVISIASTADDPRKLILYGEGPGDPGSYYFIDYETKSFKIIGETRPLVPSEWVAEKRQITYKAADGLEIPGYLTLPPGREAKNLPLIVLPHGGPQARDDISYDWMSQAITSRGYAVFQPNFRGSDGYGTAFVEAGHGEFGRKMQTDLSDGVRYLAAQGLIDPKRVCIAGASYGGYAALAGATVDRGVYRCASAIAGVSSLKAMVRFEQNEAGFDKNASSVLYWKRFMGDEAGWDAVSPDLLADKVTIPIQLIHGKDDTVVPIEQSYRMRDALQKHKKPVEFVMLKSEDHWLSREHTRVQTIEAMMSFFETHNPAYVD